MDATKFYCYILKNNDNNKTYNGFTVNTDRRIRQHNSIIKGGAKATKGVNTWHIYALISGFPDKVNALQCEWRIKHPDNKKIRGNKYYGPKGRIIGLNEVLSLDKWTNNSTVLNADITLTVYIDEEYINLITVDKPNIIIKKIEK